ncbi:MAG: hypothetical protein GW906_02265 [Epsilonproteobacteria bacterium]|nr:hypothetical protein [Campylobacterota bacterium]NCO25276.1 hypothetical protein [Campylobacterota bacterium]NCO30905.1 hypothetical protein [Campylobacterota bacterium]NCS68306.1 hypothetical protein [Campylobacterota bacterium]
MCVILCFFYLCLHKHLLKECFFELMDVANKLPLGNLLATTFCSIF